MFALFYVVATCSSISMFALFYAVTTLNPLAVVVMYTKCHAGDVYYYSSRLVTWSGSKNLWAADPFLRSAIESLWAMVTYREGS